MADVSQGLARLGQRWETFAPRRENFAPHLAGLAPLLYSVTPSRYRRRAHSLITMPAATVTGRELFTP